MGCFEEVTQEGSETNQHNAERSICLHSFSDLSHVPAATFMCLLKHCYMYGTHKASSKFRIVRQLVKLALHNGPQPGPFTYVVQCMYIIPFLGKTHAEGLSHMLTSSLRHLKSVESAQKDFLEAKLLAARLVLDILASVVPHENRILVKILETFDVELRDIAHALYGSELVENDLVKAREHLKQYVKCFMESESYVAAVAMITRLSIKCCDESLLIKLIDSNQFEVAEECATFMGKEMVCFVIQKYLNMKMLKSAKKLVKEHDLTEEFPDVNFLYKESLVKKLAEKGCWYIAEVRAKKDKKLMKYLVYLAMEAGYMEKVDELCRRYSLEGYVDSLVREEIFCGSDHLDLKKLGSEEIVWVDEIDGLLNATSYIEGCKIIGLDCEWKPNFKKNSKPNKVSIIQIASDEKAFIFDLIKLYYDEPKALGSCFRRIMCSSNILKLGYDVQCDLHQLTQSYGELECFQSYEMVLDIQKLFKGTTGGLSGLSKTDRRSMATQESAGSAAAPVDVDAYDPMKDIKRRAKSNDPGWKYGYWTEIGNRDKVTCNLCKTVTTGGIKRLKEHLAGGYGDTVMCSKTTTEIRKEMRAYLEKNKRARPIFLDDDSGPQSQQQQGDSNVSIVQPSSGTTAKRRRATFQFRPSAETATATEPKEAGRVASMLRRTPEQVVDDRRSSGSHQTTMEACTKSKADRNYVNKQWALWFYECGIPFNAINSRQFQIACEATAQYGPGYVPPSMHEVREPLLHECVKDTGNMRAEHELAWKSYGCTLMSDGWTDRRGHHLINFLVNSPAGTYFLESVDASDVTHDAAMLADLLEKRIVQIGKENVVQVVTDNGANYKAAGMLLMQRIPTLFWTPCAAHCLDLMLEDIGKLKEFKKPIAQAKRVTTFIYRHGRILSAMREKTGGMDLVRPAATRFATCFLTLKSLHKHRDALRGLFVSDAWNYNKLATTEAGKQVCDIVLAKVFWSSVEDCLRASTPLLIVLRAVDGDERPAMPEVAALMDVAKEKIKLSFTPQNKQALLKKILDIIERRWVSQMDHPLYGAALYLNPGKFFAIQKKGDDRYVAELRSCFNDVLARMEPDEEVRTKIDEFAMHYEDQRGPIFSNVLALQQIQLKSPLDWWRGYGGRAFELQRFAKRVVSLCASSSGCERNWSTFEFKILGSGLNKAWRNSNWELRPLSQNQKEYAALDALVLVHIFHAHIGRQHQFDVSQRSKSEWKSHIVSRVNSPRRPLHL